MSNIRLRNTGVRITDVLKLISEGKTYDQILRVYHELNLTDIMAAARAARELIEQLVDTDGVLIVSSRTTFKAYSGRIRTLDDVRESHPRAFERWNETEEEELVMRFRSGQKLAEIARKLRRTTGSIEARLVKLGLISPEEAGGSGESHSAEE